MERRTARGNPRSAKAHRAAAGKAESEYLTLAQHALKQHYFPRVARCVEALGDQDLWWRPNAASNSAGNLLLHLAGNARQWIVAGLGGAADVRRRDEEFREQGPIPGKVLVAHLRRQVDGACRVFAKLTPRSLMAEYSIQGFRVSGLDAVRHVVEHFAFHTGQIVYITKLRRGVDLGFTKLPGEKKSKRARLPAL